MNITKHLTFTCSALIISLLMTALPSAYAASFRGGAYKNFFQDNASICVNSGDIAEMTANAWQKNMKKRGKSCQITESDSNDISGDITRRWKADCSDEHARLYHYSLSVSASAQHFSIDSMIEDDKGKLKAKRAFLGDRQGACNTTTAALKMWDYFDMPDEPVYDAQASKAVATDLLYCGMLYMGISRYVPSKQSELTAVSSSLISQAAALVPDDLGFLNREMEKASQKAANEIVGSSAEKLLALLRSPVCTPYFEKDGIQASLRQKSADVNSK